MLELSIKTVKHETGHILNIEFNDGHSTAVDFAPFIFSTGHPDIEKYKSIDNFLTYQIIDGNLNWDDYNMIFSIEDLYHNQIIKSRHTPNQATG
jgi:uncharacterized protein DUF2442